MKIENSLSQKYLLDFPVEAARVLEHASNEDVTAFISELNLQTAAPVTAAMLPEKAAACLELTKEILAAKLLGEIPLPSLARIYRQLSAAKQQALSALMPAKTQKLLKQYLSYPAFSAGALLNHKVDILPDTVTVADAIRRIEHLEHSVNCEIYIVNETHQLVGMIELGRLLTAGHHLRLRQVMTSKTQPVSVHASADSLPSHPGWSSRRRLPVVERNNTLVGVLEYRQLQDVMDKAGSFSRPDPVENLLSLTHLYWISLAQLLNSIFTETRADKKTSKGVRK